MKFTPLDVRHKEFGSGPLGYRQREVRDFLVEVADEMENYERQARQHAERLAELEAQVNELRGGEEGLRRALVSAERISNEMRSNAQKEAQVLVKEAEGAKDKLLREALQKSRDIRLEIDRARSERGLFLSQFRALLQGYLASLDRLEDKATE